MNTNKEDKPHVHAALIKAWADGAKIQYFNEYDGEWRNVLDNTPLLDVGLQYRIKPEEPEEPWKPKDGETFYFVTNFYEEIKTSCAIWYKGNRDVDFSINNNYFRTREEAEAAAERAKAALKGENFAKDINVPTDVSGNVGSNVGSPEIDGKPMSEQEIHLIRQYRDRVAENWKDACFFWITGPEMDLITTLRLMRDKHGFPEQEATK